MGQIVSGAVERYLASLNHQSDAVLSDIARAGARDDLPLVDPEVGALLRVLVLATQATRVLEIGTAIGYSGIWMASALPANGMFITMEIDESRATMARENFSRAGLTDRVNVIVGDAQRTLHKIAGPFDLVFQDGDKRQYLPLLDPLVGLLRDGGLLVTDNVLWNGEIVPDFAIQKRHRDPADGAAIAKYNEAINNHPSLVTSIVPLRDGVAISARRSIRQ
ncbi:MAG TPA: O-methyltransferase [Vicinamibacterales bacterium]|nr:O-methyltransferase [Vicinamibacterales bacterium]